MKPKTQAKHTPGPWEMSGKVEFYVSRQWPNFKQWIAKVDPDLDPKSIITDRHVESEANARLIAAAPDLLEAARRAIVALEANGAPNCEAIKELRAAIAKAEGKQ